MPLAERNGLILDYLAEADALAIAPLYFKAFHVYPFFQRMTPDTPAGHRGWTDATMNGLKDPSTICLKVTDVKTSQIVGHGRWCRPAPEEITHASQHPGLEEGRRPESFISACDEELAGLMFDTFDKLRMEHWGTMRHWYMELLLTDPDYQGRGCASMILRHGCELADRDQLPCYIDSSPMGKPLYEKMGWKFDHKEDFPHGISYYFGTRQPQKVE